MTCSYTGPPSLHQLCLKFLKRTSQNQVILTLAHISGLLMTTSRLLSKEEVWSNPSFMMMAGSETTATLLSGCTFFALKYTRSFLSKYGTASPPRLIFSSLADVSCLRVILQETLRMYHLYRLVCRDSTKWWCCNLRAIHPREHMQIHYSEDGISKVLITPDLRGGCFLGDLPVLVTLQGFPVVPSKTMVRC